jgi:hypothetical protein
MELQRSAASTKHFGFRELTAVSPTGQKSGDPPRCSVCKKNRIISGYDEN